MKEKRRFASSPFLVCFAVALGVSYALPAAGSELGQMHENAMIRMYADQDAEAARARALVEEAKAFVIQAKYTEASAKYTEAIQILKDNVIDQLQEESRRVDSWRGRQRLAEFTEELNRFQLEFGNLKLKMAEIAIESAQFDTAIALASDAIVLSEALRDRAMAMQATARGRKDAAARRDRTAAEVTDPNLPQREADIRLLLAKARNYFRSGLYDKAWEKVEEIYVLNPFNAEASYLASQIYEKFYEAGVRRRRADVQSQLAFEAWQWIEPVFPVTHAADPQEPQEAIVQGASDYAIQQKLDAIVFPLVDFKETDLEAVVQFIRNNAGMDPDKVGVPIFFIMPRRRAPETTAEDGAAPQQPDAAQQPAADEGDDYGDDEYGDDDYDDEDGEGEGEGEGSGAASQGSKSGLSVTLFLRNVTLRQLLDYICFLTDLTYVVRENGVVFGASDQSLYSQDYEIFNSVKAMIAGQRGSTDSAAGAPADDGGDEFGDEFGGDEFGGDEFGDEGGEDGGEEADAPQAGADAPAAPIVNEADLTADALRNFFSLYGIEFPERSSIGYYRGRVIMNNTAENHRRMAEILRGLNVEDPMVEIEVKSIELSESDMEELGFNWALSSISSTNSGGEWYIGKGSNTNPGGMLSMLNNTLSGIDSRLITGLNIFPDLFGSFKPFGSDQGFNLSLTINALDRSDRTEQISAPRVLVANGVRAEVRMTKSYFFPEEWEELEVETDEIGDTGRMSVSITPPSPTFGDSESKIGTEFSVTPTILEGGKTIRLVLNPRITAYTGKDEYDVVVRIWERQGNEQGEYDVKYVVWRPVIATRSLSVTVDVNHGETLVIGGLSNSITQRRIDRIPILSDIPFIGRLFQSQSEVSNRRNMLIFVTARLVGNDGVPLPMVDNLGTGGIPRIVR